MAHLILAIGLVLCIEGLVVALIPGRIEEVLDALRRLPVDARRLLGLLALAFGVAMIALARAMGL